MMMYQGYLAGWASAPVASGGLGTPEIVHPEILGWTTNYIGGFILLAAIGALLGGLGYVLRSRMK